MSAVSCQMCGTKFRLTSESVPERITCKHCGNQIHLASLKRRAERNTTSSGIAMSGITTRKKAGGAPTALLSILALIVVAGAFYLLV